MSFHHYLTPELVRFVVSKFKLSHSGVHGPSHWMRVRKNGLELAQKTGANTGVVELFALFHDSCRVNEDTDHGHGSRGADFAQQCFDDGLLTCSLGDLKLLKVACQQHTGGTYAPNETVATCWDADRLDLPRVFIQVNPQLLCTQYAKDPVMIEAANQRVQRWLSKRDNHHYNNADNWSVSKPRRVKTV